MNRLDKAREIVRQAQLPEALRRLGEKDIGRYEVADARLTYRTDEGTQFLIGEVTPDVLADCLHYQVTLQTTPVTDESAVPVGRSKYNGLPHLPPGFTWPADRYFAAQINLTEFHPYDAFDAFADHGMMYVFLDLADQATVIHHAGPLDQLRVTPYPDPATFEDDGYYLQHFLNNSATLTFTPGAVFDLGGEASDPNRARALVPAAVVERVSATLGASVLDRAGPLRMFGRPIYWQGEDEILSAERNAELAAELGMDLDEYVQMTHCRSAGQLMLFQDKIADVTVHVWISTDDARKRDYSRCWMDSSST